MPRDLSGNYTLPSDVNPVVDGEIISVEWANPTMNDIALQLNNVFTRDGLLGPLGPFSIVDGSADLPGLNFSTQPNMGMYRPSANALGFSVGGFERGRFTPEGFTVTGSQVINGLAGKDTELVIWAPTGYAANLRLVANAGDVDTAAFLLSQDGITGGIQYVNKKDSGHNWYINNVWKGTLDTIKDEIQTSDTVTRFMIAGLGNRFVMNKTQAVQWNYIDGMLLGKSLWRVTLGDSAVGTPGSNEGQNFHIAAYKDDGTVVTPDALFIHRGNNSVVIPKLYHDNAFLWGQYEDASNKIVQFHTGYFWSWNKSSGTLSWNWIGGGGEPAVNFVFDRQGNLSVKRLVAGGGQAIESGFPGPFLFYKFATDWLWRFNGSTGDLEWVMYPNTSALFLRSSDKALIWWTAPAYKAGGGMWIDASDRRVKRNIRDYTQGLAAILALRPKLFNFIEGMNRDHLREHIGLVAQDVEGVMPELVGRDSAQWFKDQGLLLDFPDTQVLTLDATGVIYALVNAVREVAGLIEGIDVRLTNVEGSL